MNAQTPWRRELIRWTLAANWIMAGIACNILWAQNRLWNHVSYTCAEQKMIDQGIADPQSESHLPQLKMNAAAVRLRFAGQERAATNCWTAAVCGFAATAIALMIAFPKSKPAAPAPSATG
jgi:hypothetical protein